MEYDREVVREEELAAREAAKKKRFTLFKSKAKDSPQTTTASSSNAGNLTKEGKDNASHSRQSSADDDDDELPARLERPSSASANLSNPPASSPEDPPSNIPTKAGFDFKAIAKAIGKEDLDPSTLPMVPAGAGPTPISKNLDITNKRI